MATQTDKRQLYIAAMVLSGVGDALGYKNGDWEFCHSGDAIHKQLKELGGLNELDVQGWMISDDTVMHIATAEALVTKETETDREKLFLKLAEKYKECMNDMTGRAPGLTTVSSCRMLKPLIPKGYRIPFNESGGGCGAAMRSMCIGLRYPEESQLDDLIAVSIESGRMTHHHPTGYLGSLASALFTAYALQGKPVNQWGIGLINVLPLAQEYIKKCGVDVKVNLETWDYFENAWMKYLVLRGISDGSSDALFPEQYGIEERDEFYKSVSFSGWGGASGHDAPMIAYDAFLGAKGDWAELCSRAMFHAGDSDSTGVIAATWYGAIYGFKDVPEKNYKHLEYRNRLEDLGEQLYLKVLRDEVKKQRPSMDQTSAVDSLELPNLPRVPSDSSLATPTC